jgi:hypothetical protein
MEPTHPNPEHQAPGALVYLYRAIDRDGHLIDARLSDTRNLAAAKAFFPSARTVTGVTPHQITTGIPPASLPPGSIGRYGPHQL